MRVWIDEGCIHCGSCPTACPAVFDIGDDGEAVVRGTVRGDGLSDANRAGRGPLLAAVAAAEGEAIAEAAAGCPVEVIRVEE